MGWGLAAALFAALCFGLGSALQALAARTSPDGDLLRTVLRAPFLAGLALDATGYLAQLAALRTLPLFAVQAVIAAELAVTALAAAPLLHLRPTRRELAAIALTCAGLALLGASAAPETPTDPGPHLHWALPAATLALAACTLAALRLPRGATACLALGTLAGLAFGTAAVASRIVDATTLTALLTDPAAYTIAAAGALGFAAYTTALQRGPVTTTVAAMVVAQTTAPAALGLLLLGDHSRPGWAPLALAGFTAALAGALLLARYGEPDQSR